MLFPYLIPLLWFFFGNYAKRDFLAENKPKKALFYKSLILFKKNHKKSQQKNHVKAYKQKKIKRAETMKKTTKKTTI